MRLYQHYSLPSYQNSEVKRAWARVVLGWVTSWEVLVLHPSFLWYFSIVSGNSMFFLLITCYMPWTFRREHCPPWRNNTTGTPGAHREACGHGRGAVKTLL